MDASNRRESERDEWWRPRAEFMAQYVSEELVKSDVVLLQEWWFRPEFQQVFDYHASPYFKRVAERRPGREDGMAVLIKKKGSLEFLESQPILTAPQRIAQLVNCRDTNGRDVSIANVHLSFPSSPDPFINEQRQTNEVQKLLRGLSKFSSASTNRLQVLGGDFNSDSGGLAALTMEKHHGFVNCASCMAEQALSHTGGQVNLGVTHRTHRGEEVSVDHIFARMSDSEVDASHKLGYLDSVGTRVVDCCRGDLELEGCSFPLREECFLDIISDHRPVTATIEWPSPSMTAQARSTAASFHREYCNFPLDPLEPPSYMGNNATLIGQQ
jgi:endonuclease/exonuclease/phosphatase family metal-dependent hydrolase